MSDASYGIPLETSFLLNPTPHSRAEWERSALQILDQGQAFLAHDMARAGLESYPDSLKLKQVSALALIRTGALDEARKILEPLCSEARPDDSVLHRIYSELVSVVDSTGKAHPEAPPTLETLDSLARFLRQLRTVMTDPDQSNEPDEETLGLLASAYKKLWIRTGKPLDARRTRDAYLRSFFATRGTWTGVNAATMSWLSGEADKARELAAQVLLLCRIQEQQGDAENYWHHATVGEALLLLRREEEAITAYAHAATLAEDRHAMIVSSLEQLRLLERNGFPVPAPLFSILKPPTVVVFAGHMLDSADRTEPRFPAWLESRVRLEIEKQLDRLDARIGYSSACCGSDLLFIEAMQARGAEMNIILPFAEDDFIHTCVSYAGPRWVTRYHNALKLARSVTFVTEEPLLGDEVLFEFLGQIFHGFADLRARTLHTHPYLLSVWDCKTGGRIGGTSDLVARWPEKERMTIVPMQEILESTPVPANLPQPVPVVRPVHHEPTHSGKRQIKTMLFADVVGYSDLDEGRMPNFMYTFLERVASRLHPQASFVNTWGDAIFAVMEHALPMVEYALALQDVVCNTEWSDLGLPSGMSVRIGLHAGPVFEGVDPITQRTNFYGAHVNRTARLEPVTVPGHIYASEQFVALVTAEQVAAQRTQPLDHALLPTDFACEPVGTLTLAKGFGSQMAYHIRRI